MVESITGKMPGKKYKASFLNKTALLYFFYSPLAQLFILTYHPSVRTLLFLMVETSKPFIDVCGRT